MAVVSNNMKSNADAGFTLLEVMASVVIIGVAMTVIMTDRNESVRRVTVTDNMRTATMLANRKISEILLGMETGVSGDFEDCSGFDWKLVEGSQDILQGEDSSGSLQTITLTVTYPAGPSRAELTLNAYLRGGN